jgi:hypothetical protein
MTQQPDVLQSEFSDSEESFEYRSPLWMVTQHPRINELVKYLEEAKIQILANPGGKHELKFSLSRMDEVRAAFSETIRRGERRLHRLCELLCNAFLAQVQMHSVVIGEVPTTHERFTLIQNITKEDLYSVTDLDLGTRQLKKLRYFDTQAWVAPQLVANVVEYQATEQTPLGLHKIVSRIKAEEELWNKVVDEIFNLDALVRKDKKFWHLSRYVKDIFGLKLVTSSIADVVKVHEALLARRWSGDELSSVDVAHSETTERLEFLEIKNYLGATERKKSGWEALKSVVQWNDTLFEIQVQPLSKFMREREFLTKESHSGFKSRREEIRNTVAEQIPLFRFFRDLLRWMFLASHEQPPTFPGVTISLDV